MKIRTIKPEFFQSDAVRCLDVFARMAFVGLWLYVDDNGVGLDSPALLAAELFPGEMSEDPAGTIARVDEAVWTMADAGLVVRFEGRQKGSRRDLVAVVGWSDNQYISKPRAGHSYTCFSEGMPVKQRPGTCRATTGQRQGNDLTGVGHVQDGDRTVTGHADGISTADLGENSGGMVSEQEKHEVTGQRQGNDRATTGHTQGNDLEVPGLEKGKGKVTNNKVLNVSTVVTQEFAPPVDNSGAAIWKPTGQQIARAHAAGLTASKIRAEYIEPRARKAAATGTPWTTAQYASAFDNAIREHLAAKKGAAIVAKYTTRGTQPANSQQQTGLANATEGQQ